MFRPWSAKTRRTASSVPGSLRTATTSVVRWPAPAATSGRAPGIGPGEHEEPRPVAGQVADLVGEDLQTEQGGRPGREDRRRAALALVGDGLAGAGRVVGRQELPRPAAQERLGLAERLDVRVDPLDVVDPLARQRGQAQADRHDDLGADDEVELEQEVVVLADRAVDDVLDGHDARDGIAGGDGLEDLPEAAERLALDVTECREDRVLGERARLARVRDVVTGLCLGGSSAYRAADGVGCVLQIAL